MDPVQATESLLAVIEEDRVRQCTALEAQAQRSSMQVLGEARAEARCRVREALVHERRRLRDGLAALDAALATQLRLHDQRAFRALLDRAWERLPGLLASRWSDVRDRGEWAQHVLDCARAALPPGNWSIAHGPGWPPHEREALAESLERLGIAATFIERAGFGPGLEVHAGRNRIDGTAAGLTADAGEVGARLLECLAAGEGGARPATGAAATGTGGRP